MDNELFELCKQVAQKTDWLFNEDESDFFFYWEDGVDTEFSIRHRDECPYYHNDEYYPLYTSDYLLEKLQGWDVDIYYSNTWRMWIATINDSQGKDPDTPLKALLKLTLALHDAKELLVVEEGLDE